VNDRTVKLIVNRMNRIMATDSSAKAQVEHDYISVELGGRLYIAYFAR